VLRKVRPWALIAALGALEWLMFPFASPNYDTVYALLWGNELAHGSSPDYSGSVPPTPHPLADLWGMLLSPFGPSAAESATTVLAYLASAAIVYFVYRLGTLWFDRTIGVAAAAIVLTRDSFISTGLREYIDVPYISLCLAALALETRRPRAGWPVLALLALAGLLRPEAWLFSLAYLAYLLLQRDPQRGRLALRRDPGLTPRQTVALVALTALAPLVWGLFDLTTAGDAIYSFTGTRESVHTLHRQTGFIDLLIYGPPHLAEVLEWPGNIGAVLGVAFGLRFLHRRSVKGAAALALALAAFAILVVAGLAAISRYTLLAGALLAIFCAVGLLGWRLIDAAHPWRRRWQLSAAAVAALFVIWIPIDYVALSDARSELDQKHRVESDLRDVVDSADFRAWCGPVSVPTFRAVPWVAFWLDQRPGRIISSPRRPQHRGYFLDPTSQMVVHQLLLNPSDSRRLHVKAPPEFRPVGANGSWRLYARCP
jgi:hypothetical protein